jgi:hypothetical protein
MMALLGYLATILHDSAYDNEYSMEVANIDASINAIAQIGEQYFTQIVSENGDLVYDDVEPNAETILLLISKYMVVTPDDMRMWYQEDIYKTSGSEATYDLLIISFTYSEIEYNVGFYVNGGQSIDNLEKGEFAFSWIS